MDTILNRQYHYLNSLTEKTSIGKLKVDSDIDFKIGSINRHWTASSKGHVPPGNKCSITIGILTFDIPYFGRRCKVDNSSQRDPGHGCGLFHLPKATLNNPGNFSGQFQLTFDIKVKTV
jgi:hypothetical protein